MNRSVLWALIAALIVVIIGYVVLKIEHVEGSDTLAIAISSIIAVFVAIQNSIISKDLEKVKNQTNGMTHHIMEEAKHLRRAKTLVEPANLLDDSNERTHNERDPRPGNARKSSERKPGKRSVSKRTQRGTRDPHRNR